MRYGIKQTIEARSKKEKMNRSMQRPLIIKEKWENDLLSRWLGRILKEGLLLWDILQILIQIFLGMKIKFQINSLREPSLPSGPWSFHLAAAASPTRQTEAKLGLLEVQTMLLCQHSCHFRLVNELTQLSTQVYIKKEKKNSFAFTSLKVFLLMAIAPFSFTLCPLSIIMLLGLFGYIDYKRERVCVIALNNIALRNLCLWLHAYVISGLPPIACWHMEVCGTLILCRRRVCRLNRLS